MNVSISSLKKFDPLLVVIIFIAGFLRLMYLGGIPNGFHSDETSIGYEAYSILKTCKDEHGTFLPLYFEAFGEYKNPIFIYTVIPFIKVLGLNVFAVRLTAAIYGIVTVFFTYLLCRELFCRKIGLCAALLLSICPWHLHFSRIAFEAISFPCFFVIGFYLLVKGREKGRYLIYSSIVLAITFYTYSPAKLLVPIFLAGYLALNFRSIIKFKKETIISLLIGCVILTPLLIFTITGKGQKRFNTISIFRKSSLNKTKKYISDGKYWKPPFTKSFVDKEWFLIHYTFSRNYLLHMSPDFLFFKGDRNIRHNIGKRGQLFQFEGILIILGLLFIIVRRRKEELIMLWWFLIFPISASLTNESIPHAIRSIYGLPSFQIIAGIGIVSLYNTFSRIKCLEPTLRIYLYPFAILISLCFTTFAGFNIKEYFRRYYMEYPKKHYSAWRYDMKELVSTLETMDNVDTFSFVNTRDPYIFILFYTKYDPATWHKSRVFKKYQIGSFSRVDNKRQALVVKAGKYKNLKTIKRIKFPNGTSYYDVKALKTRDKTAFAAIKTDGFVMGGLNGQYFNGPEFGKLVLSRVDKRVHFHWNQSSPAKGINADDFSIKWKGIIKIDKDDKYHFYTTSDDGVRLFIDDYLIIENWSRHRSTENMAEIYLDQGVHNIRVEYNDVGRTAKMKLLWSSSSIEKIVVPSESLGFYKTGD